MRNSPKIDSLDAFGISAGSPLWIPWRVCRFWQIRTRHLGGILLCFCVFGLMPTGYGQGKAGLKEAQEALKKLGYEPG